MRRCGIRLTQCTNKRKIKEKVYTKAQMKKKIGRG